MLPTPHLVSHRTAQLMEYRVHLRLEHFFLEESQYLFFLAPPFSYKLRDHRVRGLQLLQRHSDSNLGFGVWG